MSTVILVVDDEKELRELMRRFLQSKGFTVYLAATGAEGVSVFREYLEEISVVVTDLNMPQMNGLQMIDQLLQLKPTIRIVILAATFPAGYPIPPKAKLLYKPCHLEELLRLIQ